MPFYKIRPKAGTVDEWEKANPILGEREIGFEYASGGLGTGKVKMKMGDGSTPWNDLPYAVDGDIEIPDNILTADNISNSAEEAPSETKVPSTNYIVSDIMAKYIPRANIKHSESSRSSEVYSVTYVNDNLVNKKDIENNTEAEASETKVPSTKYVKDNYITNDRIVTGPSPNNNMVMSSSYGRQLNSRIEALEENNLIVDKEHLNIGRGIDFYRIGDVCFMGLGTGIIGVGEGPIIPEGFRPSTAQRAVARTNGDEIAFVEILEDGSLEFLDDNVRGNAILSSIFWVCS